MLLVISTFLCLLFVFFRLFIFNSRWPQNSWSRKVFYLCDLLSICLHVFFHNGEWWSCRVLDLYKDKLLVILLLSVNHVINCSIWFSHEALWRVPYLCELETVKLLISGRDLSPFLERVRKRGKRRFLVWDIILSGILNLLRDDFSLQSQRKRQQQQQHVVGARVLKLIHGKQVAITLVAALFHAWSDRFSFFLCLLPIQVDLLVERLTDVAAPVIAAMIPQSNVSLRTRLLMDVILPEVRSYFFCCWMLDTLHTETEGENSHWKLTGKTV